MAIMKQRVGLPYLIVQIDPEKRPSKSNGMTGDGTFLPVTCDGHYADQETATDVAKWFAEKNKGLLTYVVKIVGKIEDQAPYAQSWTTCSECGSPRQRYSKCQYCIASESKKGGSL